MHIKETFPELYKIRRPVKREEIRARLGDKKGKEYWRSLEELAESGQFEEFLHTEFPRQAGEWDDEVGRRTFLKLMGASLALAGLTSCSYQPPETVVPFVRQPAELVPGKPLFFATAMPFPGGAAGLFVRSNEGRPTHVEGNPDHPTSGTPERPLGERVAATDIFSIASILSLYDPDRSETITNRGEIRPYSAFLGEVRTRLDEMRGRGGGLRFLTETVTSPTTAAQLRSILAAFPGAKWHQYEPAGTNSAAIGAQLAFGQPVNTIYRFERADRVLSLDSDFLSCGAANLRYARDFASKRRVNGNKTDMNRLYVVETTPTNTGAFADHRFSVKPSQLEPFARALAAALGAPGVSTDMSQYAGVAHAQHIAAIAKDLQGARGRSIVVAGEHQSAAVHALAHAMNQALGNVGQTVVHTEPIEAQPVDQVASLRELVGDIEAGRVEMLVIVGGNPVYNAPMDLALTKERLDKIRTPDGKDGLRIHLSLYDDETSELCHWHIPETHFLEAWGDTRAHDGTVSIIQPLIAPLYRGRSVNEFLAAFTDKPEQSGYDIVRDYWRTQRLESLVASQPAAAAAPAATPEGAGGNTHGGTSGQGGAGGQGGAAGQSATGLGATGAGASASPSPTPAGSPNPAPASTPSAGTRTGGATTAAATFDEAWRRVVHDGVIPGTAAKEQSVTVGGDWSANLPPAQTASGGGFEIVFRPDPTVYDGRFANNGWLQELPKPLTKLTWDNAAYMSLNTARRMFGLNENDYTFKGREFNAPLVDLRYRGQTVRAPVLIVPGQPDDVITVTLGYGRTRAGRVGTSTDDKPLGYNAYRLRTSDAMWHGAGLEVAQTGEEYLLAVTQLHFNMEGREIVQSNSLEEYLKGGGDAGHNVEGGASVATHKGAAEVVGKETHKLPGPDDTLYPNYEYKGYKWGMSVDVASCVGCQACVIACQSENNIPIVGKEQVARSRYMHWLRVDTYFKGIAENPEGVHFMPIPCMHCEVAPCEPVCPVHATVHSAEGTNDMVYNRCIGTRYCSNNCPYKVRRFNFLLYQDFETPSLKMMRNPDVTVRSRGVMEKCTYCIQRINYARIEAEKEERRVRDGEIVTACQSACPTEAIIFGDLNDEHSRVAQLQHERRNYSLLAELNTRPRTTYLSALRNPNAEIHGA
ncbi:MAG TPA: TAT-variant-translocated molybdopterin oxidoreductase [Pyrinomonadaceae bacterium]|nr:TAT-variant-translocated molybdopterin oxidoreductase [Pyrinomonadaceae bacterium]